MIGIDGNHEMREALILSMVPLSPKASPRPENSASPLDHRTAVSADDKKASAVFAP